MYQTPPVPEGWHGRNLVRIVDPAGLAMAWVSPQHAGAIVSFLSRITPDVPWITVIQASADPASAPAILFDRVGGGVPVWMAIPEWDLVRRDPTSLTVGDANGLVTIECACEPGQIRIHASWTRDLRLTGRLSFDIKDATWQRSIDTSIIRTERSIELLLFHAEEAIAID
ncbi:MAG: hypothetical protein WKF81_08195 [Thermomicrobiales bacterium]